MQTIITTPDPVGREPWPGESEALAEAAAAGRRAADWIRALPAPDGDWITGPLADAVEQAFTGLDPGDCDEPGRAGRAGVSEAAAETLEGLPYAMPHTAWLTPNQQIRLLAVVAVVTGVPRLLSNDAGTVIQDGELSRMCELLDSATQAHAEAPPGR